MDKRIRNSEAALKRAYLKLMKKKDPCSITVKELCDAAGLNRSTFYERFGYMKALEENVISDCLEEVCLPDKEIFGPILEINEVTPESIKRYMEGFLGNEALMRFCASRKREEYLALIIRIQSRISMNNLRQSVSYYPAYFQNAGVLSVLLEWLNRGKDLPEEELISVIHEFSKAMLYTCSENPGIGCTV